MVFEPADEQSTVVALVAKIDHDDDTAMIRVPWLSSVTNKIALVGLQGHLKCPASNDNLKFFVGIPPSTPAVVDVFPLRMMMDLAPWLGGSLLHIRISGVHSFPQSAKVGRQSVHIAVGKTELLVLQARRDLSSPGELELAALIPHVFEGGHSLKVHFQDPAV